MFSAALALASVLTIGAPSVGPIAALSPNRSPVATSAHAYSPPAFEGPNAGARGWGSVMLRLRLRLDANGRVSVPARPR